MRLLHDTAFPLIIGRHTRQHTRRSDSASAAARQRRIILSRSAGAPMAHPLPRHRRLAAAIRR